jgi:PKD repeat protein
MKKISVRSQFIFLFVALFSLIINKIEAQQLSSNKLVVPDKRTCGTLDHHDYLKQTRPNYEREFDEYNKMLEHYLETNRNNPGLNSTNAVITIPVVIHVVYRTTAENITDAQAISQFSVLNADFQRTNSDTALGSAFYGAAGRVNFQFCLAQRDPNGNPTTGIVRKQTTTTTFSTNDAVKFTAQGGDNAWDVTRYMNIWVCNLGASLLGYGEFPTTALSNTWGLVLNYTCTGTIGTAQAPFDLGRTGTHEFGHCFNLFHIWGDDNGACTGSDQCTDTPNQGAENYGCPNLPRTDNCTAAAPGVMCMNYMDYTDDACMVMFSKQQCTRMLAVVSNPPWNVLQSSNACTPLSALDAGLNSFLNPSNGSSTCSSSLTPQIVLTNSGSSTLTSSTISYSIDGGTNQTLNWTGSLTSGSTTTVTLNAFTGLTVGSHTILATVSSPNGGNDQNTLNNTLTSTFSVVVGQTLPFTEGFEGATFVPANWTYTPTNATNKWARVTTASGFGTSTACAKMDNFTGNTNITGQKDIMTTPPISLANSNSTLKLKFDVAYARASNTSKDTLNVWISTNCGASWTKIYTKGGSALATAPNTNNAFTPTATQWRKDSISLTAYAGQSIAYFRFESVSGSANNVYLDNINLNYVPANAPPVANITTSINTVCVGQSVALTDASTNSPTSWNWQMPGGTPSSSTTQNTSVAYNTAGVYTVTLTSTNASGSGSATKVITVNASPSTSVTTQTTTICSGQSATITASGATTYSWSSGQTTSSITVNPTATTTYTVTGTSNGCSSTATQLITVNALPNVVVNSTVATICSGQSVSLNATGATTYLWNSGQTTSSITVNPSTSAVYTVTGTSNGCSATATKSITVNAIPNVSVNATSSTICSGQSATITASGAITYSWNSGQTAASITVSPSTNTTYTVTGTSNGCSSTATQLITVNAVPTLLVNATNNSICAGQPVTITVSGANSYLWNSGQTTPSITVTPGSNTTYTVTGTSNGCSSTATQLISVNAIPVVSVNSVGNAICAGQTATLTATGATSYSWSSGQTTSSIIVSPTLTTNYSVIGNNGNAACSDTANFTLNVNPLPQPTISSSADTICLNNGTITLNGFPAGGLFSGQGVSGNIFNPSTLGVGSYSVSYTYTDNNSCSNSVNKILYVVGCTGILNIDESEVFTVFPNPAKEFIEIHATKKNIEFDVTIISLDGKIIYTQILNELNSKIPIDKLSDGTYFLRITNKESVFYKKVIIRK